MRDSFDMETHEPFLQEELLPLIINYAWRDNHPDYAAVLAALAAVTVYLSAKGFTQDELMSFMAAFVVTTGPETIQ